MKVIIKNKLAAVKGGDAGALGSMVGNAATGGGSGSGGSGGSGEKMLNIIMRKIP